MGNEIVTLYVGPKPKHFLIHKNFITKHSDLFDKALNGKFKDTEEQVVYLPEDCPSAFKHLVSWVYLKWFPITAKPAAATPDDVKKGKLKPLRPRF